MDLRKLSKVADNLRSKKSTLKLNDSTSPQMDELIEAFEKHARR